MHPPFEAPPLDRCTHAWYGGRVGAPPPWPRTDARLDVGGVHCLLRRAQLPEAELRHMGWTRRELSEDREIGLSTHSTAIRLGRIVLDRRETVWTGDEQQTVQAARLGHQVIDTYFVAT